MQRYLVSIENRNPLKIRLADSDIHHIKNVMRQKINDIFIGFVDGVEYRLAIKSLNPFDFQILNVNELESEIFSEVTLLLAMTKKDKFELVIEKATELGVSRIIPIISNRVIKRISQEDYQKHYPRYLAIIKEAAEQSGRTTIPKLGKLIDFGEIGNYLSEKNIIGSLSNNALKYTIDKKIKSWTVLIGPEGGFDGKEEAMAIEKGFIPMSFGKRILRAETAAIYAVGILGNYLGDEND